MKLFVFLISIALLFSCTENQTISYSLVSENNSCTFYLSEKTDPLLEWAVNDLANDLEAISGIRPAIVQTNTYQNNPEQMGIYVGLFSDEIVQQSGQLDTFDFNDQWEKFSIIPHQNNLIIAGSDTRGTVYAVFEIAEQLGISPWKWWADVHPSRQKEVLLKLNKTGITSAPSVQYRGIFLNDEDWGLQPWAAHTFEPETGDIGPKTYEKIFQLLLRLKANTIWPAMHPSTKAFYSIPGNKEMAQKYHMLIGTSHAEPMLRNNVDEWKHEERGDFNYFTNSAAVNQYWQERIEEVKDPENQFIATVGMRGVHDGRMEGNATRAQQVEKLANIIDRQRTMLANTLDKPIETIPQVFVPYKEVLTLYNEGLQVPDDITLMWTDDNYGYIRRLSNETEQLRAGGSGVYYHLSYWGRPHDYLWLSSTQPGLIWYEMTKAYENGAQKIWIANVGDIKPSEYNMEFFLDLAWDINSINETGIKTHLNDWASREFGNSNGQSIADLMNEYYRLAMLRKPEFMGWSRTEPSTATQMSEFSSTANGNEVQRRINQYQKLEKKTVEIKTGIPKEKLDAYFQLVEYQVKGAAQMNYKFLYAQIAASENNIQQKKEYSDLAQQAYDSIASLTLHYNQKMSLGKWKQMMSFKPRNLAAYQMPQFSDVVFTEKQENSTVTNSIPPMFLQAKEFDQSQAGDGFKWKIIQGLGYSNSSITLFPFKAKLFAEKWPTVDYSFEIEEPGEYLVEVRCLPIHANNFDHKISISVDDETSVSYSLNTKGRSEAWKQNVLRNYASAEHSVKINKIGKHRIQLGVNQTGMVIDQIAIKKVDSEAFYEIPLP